jgi:hypothetical protein
MTSPANWTVVHPVAEVVAAFPGTTSVGPTAGGPDKVWGDEDWLTLLIARSSSEEYVRVRGGQWTNIDYEPDWPTEYSLEFIEGKQAAEQQAAANHRGRETVPAGQVSQRVRGSGVGHR